MSQNFTPATPALNSLAVSQTMRDNFAALLSSHDGAVMPAYAVAGMPWFDGENLKIVKERGSKAFGGWAMGATINLAVALAGSGQDGSTVLADVRVQDGSLLGTDYLWDLTGSDLKLYFLYTKTPAYFAGQKWEDPIIGQPVLFTSDGKLIGKNWETLDLPPFESVYATASPLTNEADFADTSLRAVDLEQDKLNLTYRWTPLALTDHAVLDAPTGYDWSDFIDDGGKLELLVNGAFLAPEDFIVTPFHFGGLVKIAVYSCDGAGSLTPFASAVHELRIRKPS